MKSQVLLISVTTVRSRVNNGLSTLGVTSSVETIDLALRSKQVT